MTIQAERYPDAEVNDLVKIRRFVEKAASKIGGNGESVADVVLAVNEAITNIMIHGYRETPGCIEIVVRRTGNDLIVSIRDEAPLFNPSTVKSPDVTLPLEQRQPGGLGVHLMRNFVDEMIYRKTDDGNNELMLVKRGAIGSI